MYTVYCNFWSTPIGTIVLNVISNAIFLGLTIWASTALFKYLSRKRIQRFFGLNDSSKISIYVALIRTWEDKAMSLRGDLMHFSSWAVAYDEFNEASKLRERFHFVVPALSEKPGLLSKLFVSDVQVDVSPSVLKMEDIPLQNTIISVGGPICNLATEYIQNHTKSRVSLIDGKIVIKGVTDYADGDVGVIQRLRDNDRCLFLVAGLSTLSTVGALNYLSMHWDKLEQKHKDDEFLLVLRFSTTDFRNVIEVMFEKKLSN